MALDVYFTDDIRQTIVAGVVMCVETARANGTANIEHVGGVLSLAKHQALTFGIPWAGVIGDARLALDGDALALLDAGDTDTQERK